jgi:hypothetical protein
MVKEIEKKGLIYQLVPPNNHRSNKAERAIQTFKSHFVSGLCTLDDSFPMHTWDKLIPQAEKTLNMLRTSKINPMISAHDQIYGAHSFLATPMAPPGIRVIVHRANKLSWDTRDDDAWYIGPAPNHYKCYEVYMKMTNKTRISDKVDFRSAKYTIPHDSPATILLRTLNELK